MATKFGTNRGQKVHVVNPATLDNLTPEALCGRRIDTILANNFVNGSDRVCGNCSRTHKYKELVA